MNQPQKKAMPVWLIVLIVVIVGGVLVVGVLSALAIHGVRKYIANAKQAEGRAELGLFAKGMLECAKKEGKLPPTSLAVPALVRDVSGKKYQSNSSDWSDAAFVCAGFSIAEPQYFQYQWVVKSETQGVVTARADLDGDARAELLFEIPITCDTSACTPGALTQSTAAY